MTALSSPVVGRHREVLTSLNLPAAHVEILSGGFHSDVILVVDSGAVPKVVKIIGGKTPMSEREARILAENITTYHDLLEQAGIRVAPLHGIELLENRERGGVDVVQIAQYSGRSIDAHVRNANPEGVRGVILGILEVLAPIFAHRESSGDLTIGIDPKPSNFTLSREGVISFVDTMPPRFRKDGVALVEFPGVKDPDHYRIAYERHYTVAGVLLVLETQMNLLNTPAREAIRETIRHAARNTDPAAHAVLRGLDDDVEQILSAEGESVLDALTAKDMYLLRMLGCAIVSRQRVLPPDWLKELFVHTHFDIEDGITEEHLNAAKDMIRSARIR